MADILCLAVFSVFAAHASGAAVKRSIEIQLTIKQQQTIVDVHNELRGKEGAADMQPLVWNYELAEMAQEYANRCTGRHGNPYRVPPPFQHIGQNIWMASYAVPDNIRQVVDKWFSEKSDYTLSNNSCKPSKACGHYTQLVWAETTDIGCGYADCKDKIGWNLVYCNYGPAGNLVGKKPYQPGPPCTKCASGKMWCYRDLCASDCTKPGDKCQCQLACQHGGIEDQDNCQCRCRPGWYTTDCSEVCENKDYKCGHLPGWPKTWCAAKEITATCPVMCDVCEPAGDETTETPTEAPTTQPTTTQPPTTQPPTTEPTTEQTTPEDDEC